MITAETLQVFDRRADWSVDVADVRNWVWELPRESVHQWITSPPYYGLRDYGVKGQIGLEKTPEEYIAVLVDLFRGCCRALHPSGTLWLNIGDSYEEKELMGMPWRVALALQGSGWYLRSDVIWSKPNVMPESADDRPCKSHEYVFMFAKEKHYFYDSDAIREEAVYGRRTNPNMTPMKGRKAASSGMWRTAGTKDVPVERGGDHSDHIYDPSTGRNKRTVWTIPTFSFPGAHFATFPPKLVLPMILAGTSAAGVCRVCGLPWLRQVEKERVATRPGTNTKVTGDSLVDGNRDPQRHVTRTKTIGWNRQCNCGAYDPVPAVVGDPFAGSGTTLMVARDRGRRAIGCELNPEYAEMARKRIGNKTPGIF